jgi:hypothetical protein
MMSAFIDVLSGDQKIRPQAIVLLDPATGQPYAGGGLVPDSTGALFNPAACSHVYAYNASGLVTTDTATDGTATWVKTYSYTGANLTGETKWVKQ